MTITIRKACRHDTQRGSRMTHGRVESPFMVKLLGNTSIYRVYEDWTLVEPDRLNIKLADRKPVPLVVIVKGEKIQLTDAQRLSLDELDEDSPWTIFEGGEDE